MIKTGGNLQKCIREKGKEFQDFELHLIMEYANENLTFWMACERFLEEPTFEFASEIIEGYIVPNCENPINVPNKMLKNLTADLISLPPKTNGVKKAMRHVFDVLKGGYERFSEKNTMKSVRRNRRSRVLSAISLISTGLRPCLRKPSTGKQK